MIVYLAARYNRREELAEYKTELEAIGYIINARWLSGEHGVEATPENNVRFAQEDVEDVQNCEILINFTESPECTIARGGRHVELGLALQANKRVIVVGYRENIFHWLPQIEFYETWNAVVNALNVS